MTRYKFAIVDCPICCQVLGKSNGALTGGIVLWECPTKVSAPGTNNILLPHYQVEWVLSDNEIVQHMIVGPYYLETFNADWLTRIYKRIAGKPTKLVATVPQIHPDEPSKMEARIDTLVYFI
jgi:hypothetical protein